MTSKAKKICFVATTGKCLALFLLPQANHLARHGWDVTLVASEDSRLRLMADPGIKYITMPMRRGVPLVGIFTNTFRLYKLFRRERFTFVQYFMPNAAFYSAIAAKLAGIRYRYYQLGGLRYSASTGIKRAVLKLADRIACACSTEVVAVSRGNLDMAVKDGIFPQKKGIVIGHGGSKGVDLKLFDINAKEINRKEFRAQLGIEPTDIVVGFAGSIRRDKGCGELFEAFLRLTEMHKNLKLLLLGDRDYYQTIPLKLREAVEALPQAIFVPGFNEQAQYVPYDDMPRRMAAFDILAFPSYREGLPNVVLEAQALAIPVVVAAIPGSLDAFSPGETGISIPVRDTGELIRSLAELILSEQKRREMGTAGRAWVENRFDQAKLLELIRAEKEAKL